MATADKISISLPHEVTDMLRRSVESGEYGTTSEVIREALRDWREKRDRKALEIETLRGLWRGGVESGEGRHGDINAIKQAARARLTTS